MRLQTIFLIGLDLRCPDPEDRIFRHMLSQDISIVLRETTISDSIETGSLVETKIVKGVYLSTVEITEITQFKKMIFRVGIA